jgi:hypothetical protein
MYIINAALDSLNLRYLPPLLTHHQFMNRFVAKR